MNRRRVRSTLLGYGLLAPSLFGAVCFLLLPMLVVVWLSLHRWDLLGPISYVGLDNWRSVLTDPGFGKSLLVTVAFIAIVVPAQVVLGLAAAAMLARGLPGTGAFRALYVIPWICSPLAVAVLWRWILAPTDGAVGTVLGRRIEWLTDPGLALPVGVDVSPFFAVLDGPRVEAPGGSGFAAGFQAITPFFDEMFLGRRPVAQTLGAAQRAANTAAQR